MAKVDPYPPPYPGTNNTAPYPGGAGVYPPAPVAYPAPVTQQPATVVIQPMMTGPVRFGKFPANVVCQHCNAQVMTCTTYSMGTFTWVLAFLFCCMGWWFCVLIPFCVNSCKDVIHTCPNCRCTLGRYTVL